jgi:nicotinate (nicotinamide) nucleotide adenylyltransferase
VILCVQVLRHVASSLQAYMQPQLTTELQQQQQGSKAPAAAAAAAAATSSSATGSVHAHGLAAAAAAAANLTAKAEHPAAKPAPGTTTTTATTTSSSSKDGSAAAESAAAAAAAAQPRVMLLCGADLLATINKPGVWKDPDVILQEHGIVCICRAGTDVEALFQHPNSVLGRHRDKVVVVQEPVQNVISSSMVRWLLAHASPVRYLVPDAVLGYIHQHGLYSTYTEGAGVLHV